MKKLLVALLFLTLIISTMACSELGLKDVDETGAGVGYLFVSTPIDESGEIGEDKRIIASDLDFELEGEGKTLSSSDGDRIFDQEVDLPNGEYELSIRGMAGGRYYGHEFICSSGESFTTEQFDVTVPINDTVYISPRITEKLEQRRVYLVTKDQTGESLAGDELDEIRVDGVNIEQLDDIDLDTSLWSSDGIIILDGVFIGERDFQVVTEENARGLITTEVKSKIYEAYSPTYQMDMTVASGYRFIFDADNYDGVNADEIEYVHLAGEFNGFDDESRDFVLSRQDDGTWMQEFHMDDILAGVAEYEGEIDNIDYEEFIDFKWIVNGGWVPEGFGNNLKVDDDQEGVEIITGEVNPIDPIIDDYEEPGDDEESAFETKDIVIYFRPPDFATDDPVISVNNGGGGIDAEDITMSSAEDDWYRINASFLKDNIDPDAEIYFQISFAEYGVDKVLYADEDYDGWLEYDSDELWIDGSNTDWYNWEENDFYLDDDAYSDSNPDQ